jgi:hypothetical protein
VKTSEKIDEIASALVQAQAQMGAAFKDSTNPHYKSGFASLESVIFTVKEPLHSNGLSFVQPTIRTDGFVGCETRIIHTSGQWMEGELTLPLTKQDPQAAGSAITYARRYSLMSMLGCPTTDDDAESAIGEDEVEPILGSIVSDEVQEMFNACMQTEDDMTLVSLLGKLNEEEETELFNCFPTGKKQKMKDLYRKLQASGLKKFSELEKNVLKWISDNDSYSLYEEVGELSPIEKQHLSKLIGEESTEDLKRLCELGKSNAKAA